MLVGDERHLPYDRPPLSKQVLAGAWPPEKTMLADRTRLDALGLTIGWGAEQWPSTPRRGESCSTTTRRSTPTASWWPPAPAPGLFSDPAERRAAPAPHYR